MGGVLGGAYFKEDLKAVYVILHGSTLRIMSAVKVDEQFMVHDFILDEAGRQFIPRERGKKEKNNGSNDYCYERLIIHVYYIILAQKEGIVQR